MRSPHSTIERLGGIATRRQLLAHGHTGYQLTADVRRGRIDRVRRGWYATAETDRTAREAVRIGGRLSHCSAAASYRLWSGFDSRIHVTVSRGASRLRKPRAQGPTVVVHWVRPGRQDLGSRETWRVTVGECLRGVVATCDRETAIACLDTAMTTLGLTGDDIREIFANVSARMRRRAAQARPGSDSGLESIARQRLADLAPLQQVSIDGVGDVDLLFAGRVVVEIDGFAYHGSRDDFERDRRRDARLVELGYVVLRFSYRQVTEEWPMVERVIRAVVARAAADAFAKKE